MSTENLFAVILAGGKGERFWPLSTPENPKPFLKFFSDRSLLQQTFDRARSFVAVDRILLVAGKQHEKISKEQLPEMKPERILLEPAGRDTAAAIGFASLHLPSEALMLVLPADHLIPDQDLFANDIRLANDFAESHGGPVTFGIQPDRPETGYGYLKAAGSPLSPNLYNVECFVEKPDRARAEEYLRQGSYYWNSGIFLWRVSRIQELLEQHLPDLWKGLKSNQSYATLPRISIDFGVMQKADSVAMVKASFRWDDVGSWNSLPRILKTDEAGNLVWGSHVGLETTNCILYAESLTMVTAGIKDLVVIRRGDHILICHKDYAYRLKELLAKLPS
ncbi:mannose-1-phosphate guanylyltransferase [bacterium]|nr:mannose-1-phosphate guanylyltransferase [bacterium]MCI0602868.1 mannose-1-phosphate guanylyltransferase [bacterium]